MPQGKTTGKKDHSTLDQKVLLRKRMLADMKGKGIEPVVLEAYGGKGDIFRKV
jgi:hypothetical protein